MLSFYTRKESIWLSLYIVYPCSKMKENQTPHLGFCLNKSSFIRIRKKKNFIPLIFLEFTLSKFSFFKGEIPNFFVHPIEFSGIHLLWIFFFKSEIPTFSLVWFVEEWDHFFEEGISSKKCLFSNKRILKFSCFICLT